MTENVPNNILAQERANVEANLDALAALNLERTGLDIGVDGIQALAGELKSLGELRTLATAYEKGVQTIQDAPGEEGDEDLRLDAFIELRDKTAGRFSETARKLREEVAGAHEELNRKLFGPKDVNAFRDAYFRVKDLEPDQLADTAFAARMVGDDELHRAVAFVADRRGQKDLVSQYAGGNEGLTKAYRWRESLPTDSTVEALIGSYAPRPYTGRDLAPSPAALKARKQREIARNQAAGVR